MFYGKFILSILQKISKVNKFCKILICTENMEVIPHTKERNANDVCIACSTAFSTILAFPQSPL